MKQDQNETRLQSGRHQETNETEFQKASTFFLLICTYLSFCHNKNLQFIIIHIKIDTIHYIKIQAKNVKENTPNYSGRDGPLRGAGIRKNERKENRKVP